MAENPTHLETHTGATQKLRVAAVPPTDPAPQAGDVYVDNTVGAEAIGFRNESGWIYVSLQV